MSRQSTLQRIGLTAITTLALAGSVVSSASAAVGASAPVPASATIGMPDQGGLEIKKIPGNLKFSDLTLR